MPWRESHAVDERRAFVEAWLSRTATISELCMQFGISRKTGHKWIQRFHQGGMSGLVDRTTAPRNRPQAVAEATIEEIVALRKAHRYWGPKKLLAVLRKATPDRKWPAASTIGDLLKRRGMVEERRRRRRTPTSSQPLAAATEPNVVWSADHKGCFRVGGRWCHPLTITDNFSRMLLRVQAGWSTSAESALPVFESAFREYGLPLRLRSDNGPPFATKAVGGLSELSIWLVRLGITPERISPGSPQENGRHERMHRTLKAEATSPPGPTENDQQRTFDVFRKEFNEERPHEALNQETPASRYKPSTRAFPEVLPEPEYPDAFELRRVSKNGTVGWANTSLLIGHVLRGQVVGFESIADDRSQVWFGPIYLGTCTKLEKGKVELIRNVS